jgi:ribosomal protein L11 methyltransferase
VLPSHEDAVSGALWDAGCSGITIETTKDGIRLVAFFDRPAARLDKVRALAAAHEGTAALVEVEDIDWVARFRETFQAFRVGRFEVVPEWRRDAATAEHGVVPLVVDPGRAFGTGTHESTRLCLAVISDLVPDLTLAPASVPRVLDIGCGTSILAIATARFARALGRTIAPPMVCDIDPEAALSSVRHATLNAVSLGVCVADGTRGFVRGAFNLVFANLMAPLLIERAREIAEAAAPGAALILSGLLTSQADAVENAFAPFVAKAGADRRRDLGEWSALVLRRNKN